MNTEDDHEREFYEVMEQMNDETKRAELRREIYKNGAYSTSKKYPGYIAKYNVEGELVAIGHYKNGGFVASEVFIDE